MAILSSSSKQGADSVVPASYVYSKNSTVQHTGTTEYAPYGRRATKKVTDNGRVTLHQRFLYRDYLQIACCDLTRGSRPCLWLITWDPSQPVATRPLVIRKDGTWYVYGWDLTKNICEVYGQHGYIRTAYSPYGQVEASGDVEQPIQRSSEFSDSETGLAYYNYRHYNPVDGRWIGREPLSEHEEWNVYIYVQNKPINHLDITGLFIDTVWDVGEIVVGAVTGNTEMMETGAVNVAFDAAAAVIPGVPAGVSKMVKTTTKQGVKQGVKRLRIPNVHVTRENLKLMKILRYRPKVAYLEVLQLLVKVVAVAPLRYKTTLNTTPSDEIPSDGVVQEINKIVKMKYPEGDEVNVGDVIWTNGGCNIRRVSKVLSDTELSKSESENEPGIMWVRNINPCSSPDIFGFEAESDFSYEGIGKLTQNELKYIEYLFHTLERQIRKKIWHNKNLLYYPVFYRLNDTFNWFIFCYDTSANKEICYEFRENERKFYILDDEELCRKIRLM